MTKLYSITVTNFIKRDGVWTFDMDWPINNRLFVTQEAARRFVKEHFPAAIQCQTDPNVYMMRSEEPYSNEFFTLLPEEMVNLSIEEWELY